MVSAVKFVRLSLNNVMKKHNYVSVFILSAIGCGMSSGWCQTLPDAGSILKEQQRTEPPSKPVGKPPTIGTPVERTDTPDSGQKILVRGFRVTGATLIPSEELQRELESGGARELTLNEIRKLAQRLPDMYRKRGLFARVLLPQQSVLEGIVEVAVLEGKLAAVEAETLPGTRFSADSAKRYITSQHRVGEPLRPDDVQWGLRNLNEVPGVIASGVLQPGESAGDVRMGMRVESPPLLTGGVYADSFGLKATGQVRAVGNLQLNSPFSFGDQATLLGVGTERSGYIRAGYSLPLGYGGLRLAANAAQLEYRLANTFAGFSGMARTYGLALSMPLLRTNNANVYGALTADYKTSVNDGAGSLNISNKVLKTITFEIRGDFVDSFLSPARNAFSVGIVDGHLNLGRNQGSLAADLAGPQTNGRFNRANWSYQRVQMFATGWELGLTANGQFAGNNLDGYEKMSLGGPAAVRAYPSGEALGDDGFLASMELRRSFGGQWQVSAFADTGRISQLHSTFPGYNAANPTRPNTYSLYGVGMGLQYGRPGDWFIKGMVATKLGTNPGRDINGKDADGSSSRVRAWVQLAKFF